MRLYYTMLSSSITSTLQNTWHWIVPVSGFLLLLIKIKVVTMVYILYYPMV